MSRKCIKRDKWYLLTFLMQRMTSTQKMSTEFEVISVTFLSQHKIKPTKYSDLGLSLEIRL